MLYWNIFWVERLRKQGFWYELNGRTITKHINTLEWGRAQTWNIHHDFTEGPFIYFLHDPHYGHPTQLLSMAKAAFDCMNEKLLQCFGKPKL